LRKIDLPAIVEKRRFNYTHLLKRVESLPEITPFFPHLPEGVCPWVFPVLAHGRHDFHTILRSKGIPAFTWGGVIHPELPLGEFPDAAFLYQNLVLLPIHQSIGNSEIQTMIDVIAEVLLHEH
jgi:dTDP-4-amino-4,6-dideoxygalactose transaminase